MSIDPPHILNLDAPAFVRSRAIVEDNQRLADLVGMRFVVDEKKLKAFNGGNVGHKISSEQRRARALAHLEAAANSIIGILLAQLVLFVFGVPLHEAVALNVVMIGVSYARSFVLRVVFSRWAR